MLQAHTRPCSKILLSTYVNEKETRVKITTGHEERACCDTAPHTLVTLIYCQMYGTDVIMIVRYSALYDFHLVQYDCVSL